MWWVEHKHDLPSMDHLYGCGNRSEIPTLSPRNPVETMRSEAEAHEIHSSKASVPKSRVHFSPQTLSCRRGFPLCPYWLYLQNVALSLERQAVCHAAFYDKLYTPSLRRNRYFPHLFYPSSNWGPKPPPWAVIFAMQYCCVAKQEGCFPKFLHFRVLLLSHALTCSVPDTWASSFPHPLCVGSSCPCHTHVFLLRGDSLHPLYSHPITTGTLWWDVP